MNKCVFQGQTFFFICWVFLLFNNDGAAQNLENLSEGLKSRIESLADSQISESELDNLFSELQTLSENPLDLNQASTESLEKIFFLNEIQVYNFLAYRENYGRLLSIFELLCIDGYDQATIHDLQPFVYIGDGSRKEAIPTKNVVKYGKHMVLFRAESFLEKKIGYTGDRPYPGSPYRFLLKYRFNFVRKIRLGISCEKDAGEVFLPHGFDYNSAFLEITPGKIVHQVILGDYQLFFGQGVNISSGGQFNTISDAVNIKKIGNGFRPHTGTEENRFFRGLAIKLKRGAFRSIFFLSGNHVDARLSLLESEGAGSYTISSILATGYHRTVSEMEAKNSILILTGGANLQYGGNRFKIGLTAFQTVFEFPFEASQSLYKNFVDPSNSYITCGVDYHYLFRKINFFGELSRSENGAIAHLHGLTTLLHPRMSLAILFRNYPRDYSNFFSSPYSISHNYNESGVCAGLKFSLSSTASIQVFMDIYKFSWLTFQADQPVRGNKCFIKYRKPFGQQMELSVSYTYKSRQYNDGDLNRPINSISNFRKNNIRFNLQWFQWEGLKLQSRVEYCQTLYSGVGPRSGLLVFQDIGWKSVQNRIHLDLHMALFQMDTYNERIYAYERDVLYSFSVPAYFYTGSRLVALCKISLNKLISIWFRISRTWYSDRDFFGSGLDQVDGNKLTQVKLQLRLKIP